jgi:NTP pyrophosphatase (non-canonical NTP hydrolase)
MNYFRFDEYQELASHYAFYKEKFGDSDMNVYYPVLGLVSESGEVADKIKKIARDTDYDLRRLLSSDKIDIIKELGDCLWYIALIAHELEYDLSEVAEININKLASRRERNKLTGSGDNR